MCVGGSDAQARTTLCRALPWYKHCLSGDRKQAEARGATIPCTSHPHLPLFWLPMLLLPVLPKPMLPAPSIGQGDCFLGTHSITCKCRPCSGPPFVHGPRPEGSYGPPLHIADTLPGHCCTPLAAEQRHVAWHAAHAPSVVCMQHMPPA